ncbi:glutamate racemase [Fibrobacter intestinalis]|uniref:Glutamate racemase n=1 Tax=Fibrobacter intestinalis TaxID=28122 RepID=A0A1M6RHH4_9BACT|nr:MULTISPECIES: glutamate racemase [Fibrobacter]PBC74991.1 glutamate racemase [Fibrobacter sp. NR9]SHK31856.1 glutamate racemase [Fibrobacter intestinalis]SKA10128.1 glutamate racemase [Fibrobacter intestinalis]
MIGVFDSGFGGLTIFHDLRKALPDYDFIYLGDNARAPYGSRSYETIYRYTLQAVKALFEMGCPLVILACNTASARALRTIQQRDLPTLAPKNRVLGIIRPTAEDAGSFSKTGHLGILGTSGTVASGSYLLEIARFFPQLQVTQQACPLWASLVENGEVDSDGTRFFVRRDIRLLLQKDPQIDAVLLACTHYPLLSPLIRESLPPYVQVVSQGEIVARKTVDYLRRHPEIENRLTRRGKVEFLTTDTPEFFSKGATFFGESNVFAKNVSF